MQIELKYNDADGSSTFKGEFTDTETSFLLQYAIQDLLKQGLLSVSTKDAPEEIAHTVNWMYEQ